MRNESMSRHDLKVVHKLGKLMSKPDALSRFKSLRGWTKSSEGDPRALFRPHQVVFATTHMKATSEETDIPQIPLQETLQYRIKHR
jgi:hypothetical protein